MQPRGFVGGLSAFDVNLGDGNNFYLWWDENEDEDWGTIFAEGGNDHVEGDAGNDEIFGGSGNDFLIGGDWNSDTENGLPGNWGDDDLFGGEGDDRLIGGAGADDMFGGPGNDILIGGGGDDWMLGGPGFDDFRGGSGNDTIFYDSELQGVTVDLAGVFLNGGAAQGDIYRDIENVFGSAYQDSLWGDHLGNVLSGWDGNDGLSGRGGDDTLDGGAGDDALNGGLGADRLIGGEGTDLVTYTTAGSMVIVDLIFRSFVPQAGEAYGDGFESIENIWGSNHGDHLGGDDQVNNIKGGQGNDRIGGRGGNDWLYGEDGDDVIAGDGGADYIDGGNGSDWAIYDAATTGVTVDFLSVGANTGEAAGDLYNLIENLQGSQHNDRLFGDGQANSIVGLNGNDVILGRDNNDFLYGNDGNDGLDGGNGQDYLEGNAGNDELVGGDGRDTMVGGTGDDDYYVDRLDDVIVELANEGADEVISLISYSLHALAHVEHVRLMGINNVNATGNAAGNTLQGNNFKNTLSGLGGNDELFGNGGNDTLDGGAGSDGMSGGAGNDRFMFSSSGGADFITDFEEGAGIGDVISLTGVAGIATFNDVLARTTDEALGAQINFGNGDSILLIGVQKAELRANDFILDFFSAPSMAINSFGSSAAGGGWANNSQYPRTAGDVNGDGRADLIGFGDAATFVSLANANGTFQNPIVGINSFGFSPAGGGWSNNNQYPRTVGDVNGDGRADIVGFGDAATFVSLGNANGTFQNPIVGINSFGFSPAGGGWTTNDKYPRTVGDVNGDGRADLIGFGDAGVFVALGNINGTFQNPIFALNSFGFSPAGGGWSTNDKYPRTAADVNGDGRDDLVGFGDTGVYVALGNANGTFQSPILAINSFGFSPAGGGWTNNNQYPRHVADVNDDGRADLVGFGDAGIYVALSNGNGTFAAPIFDLASFGPNAGGWASNNQYPRTLADVSGDGAADIVGFGDAGVFVSISQDFVV